MRFLLALLILGVSAPSGSTIEHLPVVHAHALQERAGEAWEGLQFVQVDRNGRAFLLRAQSLEVYPVSRRQGLGSPTSLRPAPSVSPEEVLDAAMGRSSDDWILCGGLAGVRQFTSGEEHIVPPPGWRVSSVAWPQSGPIVGVLPVEVNDRDVVVKDQPSAPLVLRENDANWDPVFRIPSTIDGKGKGAFENLRWRTEVRTAAGSKGSVWVAQQSAYRLRHIAVDGKLIDELVVGDGKTHFVDRPEKEWREIEAAVSAQGMKFDRAKISGQRGQRVIAGLAGATDGRLYVIAEVQDDLQSASGLVLDRFDPDRDVLERLALGDLQGSRFSLAAAKDGLFIVAANASGGRWFLDWDELDTAHWSTVPKATRNGEPIPQPSQAASK